MGEVLPLVGRIKNPSLRPPQGDADDVRMEIATCASRLAAIIGVEAAANHFAKVSVVLRNALPEPPSPAA